MKRGRERERDGKRESPGTLLPLLMSGAANGTLMIWLAHALVVRHCTAFRDLGTLPSGAASSTFGNALGIPQLQIELLRDQVSSFLERASIHHTGRILFKKYHDARVELIWLSIATMKEIPIHC